MDRPPCCMAAGSMEADDVVVANRYATRGPRAAGTAPLCASTPGVEPGCGERQRHPRANSAVEQVSRSMEPVLAGSAAAARSARYGARTVAQTTPAVRLYHQGGQASDHLVPSSGPNFPDSLFPAHFFQRVSVWLIRCSDSRSPQCHRRQLTAPGSAPAVTSPLHPAKAANTSPFSRSGTLN